MIQLYALALPSGALADKGRSEQCMIRANVLSPARPCYLGNGLLE